MRKHIKREAMTPQEALNLLNDTEFAEKHQGKQEYTDMLLMCKEALEKQIPIKPVEKFPFEVCPRCDKGVHKGMKYCTECGIALDWSDKE